MAESYIIRHDVNLHKCELGQPYINFAIASGVVPDNFSMNPPNSVLSILNKKNSGKRIKINNIKQYCNDDITNTSGFVKMFLTKSTSIDGGYEIPATKLNSSNSNVYAGVKVKVKSKSTQGNKIRKLAATYIYGAIPYNWTLGIPFNYNQQNAGPLGNGRCLSSFNGGNATPIILRNGEGISLLAEQVTLNFPMNIIITVADESNEGFGQVLYCFDTVFSKNFDIFSIYNGESGTAIKILNIDINFKIPVASQSGSATDTSALTGFYSYARIIGTMINTGDTVTPLPMDSTNTLGSAGIEIKEYAKTLLQNQEIAGVTYLPSINRISTKHNQEPSSSAFHTCQTLSEIRQNKFTPIILNEGEGIGVFAEIIPYGGVHDLIIEYTIEEVSAPAAAGETGYAYA